MAESLLRGRIQSGSHYNALLGEFLGKPFQSGASGPDAYDCYGLCRAFLARLGVDLPDLGCTCAQQAEALYRQAESQFIRLTWPRPWSMVSLRQAGTLATHCGIVLPTEGLFLHAQEKSGVLAEPLTHRYWRPRIEGYYWPRGVVEVVVMHSPVGLDHSWAFFREGISLAEMLQVADGEQSQVRVFLDGREVERGVWKDTIPTALQQVVVRPQYGDGRTALRVMGVIALSLIMGPGGGLAALGGAAGLGAGAFAAGTMAYSVGMAAVMVGGSYLFGALIPPKKPDARQESSYGWNPQTTQREGDPIPRLYGRVPVFGNVMMAFGAVHNTMDSFTTYETRVYTFRGQLWEQRVEVENPYTAASDYQWNVKLGYGDGPIQGIVPGSEKINGAAASGYAGLSLEHRPGTDSQTATVVGDRVQYDPQLKIIYGTPQTYLFPDKDIDRLAVVIGFPAGVIHYSGSDAKYTSVGFKIEIRPAGGAWHTLTDTRFQAKTTKWVHDIYCTDQTYPGGSPMTLTRGTQYEVRVTKTTGEPSSGGVGDTYLEAVQGIYDDGFRYPGLAYTAIAALASGKLNGALQFQAIVEGRILQVYDGATWSLEYSDNPAWVLLDLITRPVIRGDGAGTPYSIEYYRGVDRSWVDTDAFYALAQWCDELVPDGKGGQEKRFTFNGSLDSEDEAWQVALRVAAMCRAWPYFNGRQITVAIDKAATPVQAFSVGNILRGNFDETWFDEEDRITEINYTILDSAQDYRRTPVCIIDQEAARRVPLSAEGWGITSQSQLYRTGIHLLTVNRLMPRSVEFLADLDAIYCQVGQVVYVQHNNMDVNQGGRITAVAGHTVTVDFDPEFDEAGYSLLVRTASEADGEKPTLYAVASVWGRDITISLEDWVYVPQPNDVVLYGQTTQINDLYQIRSMQRTQDGQVRLFATAYDEDYYGPDALSPVIATQQAVTAAQANRDLHTRPPSWDQLNNAFPPEQINGSPVDDQPRLSSLTFAGNGVDTVTWVGSGGAGYGTILYRGVLCGIAPDETGTTAKYIYFDPNAENPTILYGTNDRSDLEGQERFVVCVNKDGVAYPQPCVRLGVNATLIGVEEGADVTADHQGDIDADQIVEGVRYLKTFHDYFQDPNNNVATRWINYAGSGALAILPGGLSGGKFLRVGDNSGNDMAWLIYYKSIPFDPSFLYRVQCRVRKISGTGKVYIGVAGRNGADDAWVSADGANTWGSQHYLAAAGGDPADTWTVYTGYFRGTAAIGDSTAKPDPGAPGVLHSDVRWIRPLILVNYNGQAGVTDIDDITVEIMPEQTQNTSSVYITGGTITGITDLAVADGGTGTSTGSITGTGALTFTAGGSNQNVTLTPSGAGYTILNGNVGIGTSAPSRNLSIVNNAGSTFQLSLGHDTANAYDIGRVHATGELQFVGNQATYSAYKFYTNVNQLKFGIDNDGTMHMAAGVWLYGGSQPVHRVTGFGYAPSSYPVVQVGAGAVALGVDISGIPSGNFGGQEIIIPNSRGILAPNGTNTDYVGVLGISPNNNIYIGRWSLPYAIFSDTYGGLITLLSTGLVGIGVLSPEHKLDVGGNIRTVGGGAWVAQNASGTSQAVVLNVGASSESDLEFRTGVNNVLVLKNSGKVGIGTASPNTILHAVGTTSVATFEGTNAVGSKFLSFDVTGASAGGYYGNVQIQPSTLVLQAGSFNGKIQLTPYNGGVYSNSLGLILDIAGKVGIGTASPSCNLDVNGDTHIAGGLDVGGALRVSGSSSLLGSLYFNRGAWGGGALGLMWSNEAGSHWTQTVYSATNDITMKITSTGGKVFCLGWYDWQDSYINSGNFGIGTVSPLSKLHVEDVNKSILTGYVHNNFLVSTSDAGAVDVGGMIALGGRVAVTDTNRYGFVTIAGRKENAIDTNTAAYLQFGTMVPNIGITEKMRITSAGTVGIGVTSPLGKVDVALIPVTGTVDQYADLGAAGTFMLSPQSSPLDAKVALMAAHAGSGGIASGFVLGRYGYGWETYIGFHAHPADVNATDEFPEIMRVQGNGRVGIGTAAPGATLQINAQDNDVCPALAIRQGNAPTYGWDFLEDTLVDGDFYLNRVLAGVSTNVMRFTRANGNVGIGVADPGVYKLCVGGNTYLNGTLKLGAALAISEGGTGAADVLSARANLGIAPKVLQLFYANAAPGAGMVGGDFWVDLDDDKLFRYTGAAWLFVQDAAALAAIKSIYVGSAKLTVFIQFSEPTASAVGDAWFDAYDNNTMHRWSGAYWVDVRDSGIAAALLAASTVTGKADGKVNLFIAASSPTAEGLDDLWADTAACVLHRWNGSAWPVVTDPGIAATLWDTSNVAAMADGKIVAFYATSAPTATGVGDFWFDTDDSNKSYRWDGVQWVALGYDVATWSKITGANKPEDGATNDQAWRYSGDPQYLDGGKIHASTIHADAYYELRQTMAWNGGDSCDASHPFVLDFKIPTEMTAIISAKLSFRIKPYRSYATDAASGGGSTSSAGGGQTTSSGGGQTTSDGGIYSSTTANTRAGGTTDYASGTGSHQHGFLESYPGHDHGFSLPNHHHTVSNHAHTVSDHSHAVSAHTHSLTFGITEVTNTPTVHFHVDNVGDGTFGAASADYAGDQVDLDVTALTSGAGWKAIRFDVNKLCRIVAILEVKVDITA